VIVLELHIVVQAHHAQYGGDGTFAQCQDGTDQQDLGPFPYPLAEQQLELA
jgi:hypothetical protein